MPPPTTEHVPVVQAMLHYCAAMGYRNTTKVMQQESLVALTTIPPQAPDAGSASTESGRAADAPQGLDGLRKAIIEGDWSTVLESYLDGLTLPLPVVFSVYEQMIQELTQLHTNAAAAAVIVAQSPVMKKMKKQQPARYQRIERQTNDTAAHQQRAGQKHQNAASSSEDVSDASILLARNQVWETVKTEIVEAPLLDGATLLLNTGGTAANNNGASKAAASLSSGAVGDARHSATAMPVPGRQTKYIRVSGSAIGSLGEGNGFVAGTQAGMLVALDDGDKEPIGKRSDVSVTAVATSEVGSGSEPWIAAAFRDGTAKVYGGNSGKLLRAFEASVLHEGAAPLALTWLDTDPTSPDSPVAHRWNGQRFLILSHGADGSVSVVSVKTAKRIVHVTNPLSSEATATGATYNLDFNAQGGSLVNEILIGTNNGGVAVLVGGSEHVTLAPSGPGAVVGIAGMSNAAEGAALVTGSDGSRVTALVAALYSNATLGVFQATGGGVSSIPPSAPRAFVHCSMGPHAQQLRGLSAAFGWARESERVGGKLCWWGCHALAATDATASDGCVISFDLLQPIVVASSGEAGDQELQQKRKRSESSETRRVPPVGDFPIDVAGAADGGASAAFRGTIATTPSGDKWAVVLQSASAVFLIDP